MPTKMSLCSKYARYIARGEVVRVVRICDVTIRKRLTEFESTGASELELVLHALAGDEAAAVEVDPDLPPVAGTVLTDLLTVAVLGFVAHRRRATRQRHPGRTNARGGTRESLWSVMKNSSAAFSAASGAGAPSCPASAT
mgnify:CR=1 FL=1